MITRELLPQSAELKIRLVANPEQWAEFYAKAELRQAAKISLKGFRKGKVPLEKARPFINQDSVFELALRLYVPELEKLAFTNVMDTDNVIESPVFNVINIDPKNLEIEFLYPTYPEIKLPDYKNLKTKFSVKEITKADLDLEMKKLLESKGEFVEVKRPIKMGDVINFDFKGFIDDVPFEGGEAEDFVLRVGSNSFIKGFEEQLVGLEIKKEANINVTFPADYHVPAYANKQARFLVKINKIKENHPANLTNDFVASLKIPEVNSISQLEIYMTDLVRRENIERVRLEFQKDALAEITAQVEIPLASKLINSEIYRLNENFTNTLKEQGFSLEEYYRITKFTPDDIYAQLDAEARKLLKNSFVFAEIAKLEALAPTQEDINEQIEKMEKITGKSFRELEQTLPISELQISITNRKVIDKLIEFNTLELSQKTVKEEKKATSKNQKTNSTEKSKKSSNKTSTKNSK
ncbi:trigger factor [Mycoplasma sp. 'Moose RK']|nr:trigger factor [Mycoplasma sp. 'Moose RK']MBG0730918.1 trigger factor [Mycoplasma sp. 'Moose RK']